MSIPPAHNAALVHQLELFLAQRKAAILATEDKLRILNEEVQSLEASITFATKDGTSPGGAPQRCQPPTKHVNKSKHLTLGLFPSIHKCPVELLCMVFEFSLLWDHTRIRDLLLVCRRWNHLIMNSPKLWARIQFKVTDVLSPKIHLYSRYLDACMARSQPMLLSVEIDLEEFRTLPDYLREEAMASMRLVADEEDWDDVFEWGLSLDCNFSSAKFEVNFEEIWSLLRSLTGEAGRHMARWQRLSLFLPPLDSFLASDVWELFVGVTPHLSQLEIGGIEYMFDVLDEPIPVFPDLSSLRHLVIQDSCDPTVLDLCSVNLERLHADFDAKLTSIRSLSQFSSLGSLVLKSFNHNVHPSASFTISLPHVTSLTLIGYWAGLATVHFSLPNHEILNLESSSFEELPILSPRVIRWKVYFGRYEAWSCLAKQSAITSIIYASDRLETILIHEPAANELIEVLSFLRESHLLPPTLQSAKLVDDYGGMSENLLPLGGKGDIVPNGCYFKYHCCYSRLDVA
jgi:hypothetical protein